MLSVAEGANATHTRMNHFGTSARLTHRTQYEVAAPRLDEAHALYIDPVCLTNPANDAPSPQVPGSRPRDGDRGSRPRDGDSRRYRCLRTTPDYPQSERRPQDQSTNPAMNSQEAKRKPVSASNQPKRLPYNSTFNQNWA